MYGVDNAAEFGEHHSLALTVAIGVLRERLPPAIRVFAGLGLHPVDNVLHRVDSFGDFGKEVVDELVRVHRGACRSCILRNGFTGLVRVAAAGGLLGSLSLL